MTVTTSLLATGIVRSLGDQSVKLSAVLNNRVAEPHSIDTDALSQSAQVDAKDSQQYPPLSLRSVTLNLGAASSNTSDIDSTAQQVSGLLSQLQSLATRASLGGLSKTALELLNGQFQALRLSINNVPPFPPHTVDVTSLLETIPGGLDSALGREAAAQGLKVGGLNEQQALLGDADIGTPETATQALALIANAQDTVDAQRSVLSRIQEFVDFASASTDGALANQEALRSTLSEADLAGETTGSSLITQLQSQAQNAQLAQTSRLPSNILSLLS